MDGIINVLKPSGMTSHDVVSFIRKKLSTKKVGHTGTLDPNAAGVLPICVGKATRISEYLMEKKKIYRCEMILGEETDTQDKYGTVIHRGDVDVESADISRVFNSFKGEIEQVPPMYSAVKVKGKKLYEIAREGKIIERKSRRVYIYNLDIINIMDNKILFDVECSKGTYIRTLCTDIGRALGTYGYMSFLLRTEASGFNIDSAYTLEEIDNMVSRGEIGKLLNPIDYPLNNLKEIKVIDDKYTNSLLNGGMVKLSVVKKDDKNYGVDEKIRVYIKNNFIGIGTIKLFNNVKYLKMEKVFV